MGGRALVIFVFWDGEWLGTGILDGCWVVIAFGAGE